MVKSAKSKMSFKKVLASRFFLLFISIALVGLVISVGQEGYRKHQLVQNIKQLEIDINQLETKNQGLVSLIDFFKQESYLEQEARLKLNLRKPDEKVIIVPESILVNQTEVVALEKEVPKRESRWWSWWNYFFGSKE